MPRHCYPFIVQNPAGENLTGIMCFSKKQQRCSLCGQISEALCDYPVGPRGRTCSAPLCRDHRRPQGDPADDRDYCPRHDAAAQVETHAPTNKPP